MSDREREPIKFETDIYDVTDPNGSISFGDSQLRQSFLEVLEDIKWQIERESSHQPRFGPILQVAGKTYQPDFTLLWNGPYDGMQAVPRTDYLTHDFSVAAQYDRLLDIADRFVAAATAGKSEETSRLVWRSIPCVTIHRYLMPEGFLIAITGSVAWI